MEQKIRILLAKPGLDGHDRGIKVIAAALRDAGIEVIYTGLRQLSQQIVQAAIQEDVDGIGVSILSGAHMTLFPEIADLLKENDADNILLFGGGIIPDEDIIELQKKGIDKIFTPGATTDEIILYIKNAISKKRSKENF